MALNGKQRATLATIFANPVPANIRWRDIEALVAALGGATSEGRGSRDRFSLNGVRAAFHRPHPKPETGRATVRDVRQFLVNAGVGP